MSLSRLQSSAIALALLLLLVQSVCNLAVLQVCRELVARVETLQTRVALMRVASATAAGALPGTPPVYTSAPMTSSLSSATSEPGAEFLADLVILQSDPQTALTPEDRLYLARAFKAEGRMFNEARASRQAVESFYQRMASRFRGLQRERLKQNALMITTKARELTAAANQRNLAISDLVMDLVALP